MPRHQLCKKQSRDGGIALGEVQAGTDAAALFSANENILLEHQLANVFEADGNFVQLAVEFRRKLVDQFCDGESFGDVAWEVARSRKVPDEEREDLVRIDERTVAIDGADAIAVAVRAKACVIFSRENRLTQRCDVRLYGFRMRAAEKGIARAADFVAGDAVASKEIGEQSRRGAVHGVGEEAKLALAQTVPVDQLLDSVEVRSARIEGL